MMDDSMPLYPQTYTKVLPSDTVNHPNMSQQPKMSQPGPTSPAPGPPPIYTHQPVLLGPENTITTCPFCNASIKTAVKYTTTAQTHMAAALCGMICCCCCLPYSMDSAKNADHYCPNCQRYLGTYRR